MEGFFDAVIITLITARLISEIRRISGFTLSRARSGRNNGRTWLPLGL
jgi:uncharacterized protein (DUF697 family)